LCVLDRGVAASFLHTRTAGRAGWRTGPEPDCPRAFQQGSTPVEVLILGLADAGLAPAAARPLIAELRGLRDRPRIEKPQPQD
jgi:hypothetical protein